jgi:DNA repair protein RecO (recombination protein O)
MGNGVAGLRANTMNQLQTTGIILSRTDFGEADRILTVLTQNQGKLRLMAKGVRKIKSKLAGGIELFSVSDLTYIRGRGDVGTLISSRLRTHYATIVRDLDRVQLGYQFLKQLHKATEDQPEPAYFELAVQVFSALDTEQVDIDLIELWYQAQLLRLAGHTPNLKTDINDQKLAVSERYNFDFEIMAFSPHPQGGFGAAHIKTLRLLFSDHQPKQLYNVEGLSKLLREVQPLITTIASSYLRLT